MQPNEVIVYRMMMYANPLLIVQAMYFTSKGQSVYYSTRGVISENIYFHLSRRMFSIKKLWGSQ